ncbi:major facilitator superfamily domain-containing protein [Camillea tinctor]|nr:major facilitator superfamily domain-containing protein [Camillea tinctor]
MSVIGGKDASTVVRVIKRKDDSSPIGLLKETERGQSNDGSEEWRRLERLKKRHGVSIPPGDPEDPYNWPSSRKISIGIIFSVGQLVTLMSSSITAAALDDISADLGIGPATTQITFSTYFLGLAFGPIFIAAVCEMNGRKNIWIAANLWYILWNSLCPVGYSKGLMIAGRFLAATGASAGITLTAPVMADMYRAEKRGKSLAIATFLPYLGPALGPIVGGLATQLIHWSWVFWIVSIFNVVVTLLGVAVIKESYTPVLLRRKAIVPQEASPLTARQWSFWHDIISRLGTNLLRPVQLLVQRPIMQLIALDMALGFGIYTFMLSTFAALWIDRYGQSKLSGSLHYIAISVGSTISAQVGSHVRKNIGNCDDIDGVKGKPEYRVPYMIIGALIGPVGLFWYGWSAEYRVAWILVDIGAAIFTCGSFMLSQALLAYTLDEFGDHGASANAACRLLSNILGFAFPIFGPQLYEALGYGLGNSLLALLFIVIGLPIPFCLWIWGKKLRAIGRLPA